MPTLATPAGPRLGQADDGQTIIQVGSQEDDEKEFEALYDLTKMTLLYSGGQIDLERVIIDIMTHPIYSKSLTFLRSHMLPPPVCVLICW